MSSAGTIDFYPRSPCGERPRRKFNKERPGQFLSTLSLRRATSVRPETRQRDVISIHALLAESDQTKTLKVAAHSNFYPRSPCGERPISFSAGRESDTISIHALLAESDLHCKTPIIFRHYFYPRSPCGERPPLTSRTETIAAFLSTLSLRRATAIILCISKQCRDFYPRSPCGERHNKPTQHAG